MFLTDDIIFIACINGGLLFGNDDDTVMLTVKQLKNAGLNIKDQGHPADYDEVNIWKTPFGSHKFTQFALIDTSIIDLQIGNLYTKPVPANVSKSIGLHS